MEEDTAEDSQQCHFFLKPNDVSDPKMHGQCQIEHGESVTWFMADEEVTSSRFEYVRAFG